jgi:hypothetical protein
MGSYLGVVMLGVASTVVLAMEQFPPKNTEKLPNYFM